jgi:hypothetical protein
MSQIKVRSSWIRRIWNKKWVYLGWFEVVESCRGGCSPPDSWPHATFVLDARFLWTARHKNLPACSCEREREKAEKISCCGEGRDGKNTTYWCGKRGGRNAATLNEKVLLPPWTKGAATARGTNGAAGTSGSLGKKCCLGRERRKGVAAFKKSRWRNETYCSHLKNGEVSTKETLLLLFKTKLNKVFRSG